MKYLVVFLLLIIIGCISVREKIKPREIKYND